jgi:hypothetical protein
MLLLLLLTANTYVLPCPVLCCLVAPCRHLEVWAESDCLLYRCDRLLASARQGTLSQQHAAMCSFLVAAPTCTVASVKLHPPCLDHAAYNKAYVAYVAL